MPGILPMKVIKVGGVNNQMRIAQACDRCRSKKIRCDGLTPTCTQCKNVAFECKTSDKLSRRAFPRGYTESLEDRVRALELEVRELKDLLDEKDEKIDMLSRMHSQSPMGRRKSSITPSFSNDAPRPLSIPCPREETFKILQPPFLSGEGEDAYFIGSSSGRALIDAFKRKVQESGKPVGPINTASFFPSYERSRSWLVKGQQSRDAAIAPPRLLSDQLVNIFFQEWAPLFPILHRPTFLSQYEQYVSDTSNITDCRVLTQLNLVFGIAALSQTGQLRTSIEQYEKRWSAAMEGCYLETSLASLQCLILAQVHAMLSASPMKLLHFRSRAVGMSQRLGLHLSQKRFPLGALTTETRKRIFWTLYTLDCFAAATFGLPRLIMEADVECEYPVDADDEFVTEEGFMPVVPGASTKLSSALALFRCSRVLAKVLEGNYPASASHELSLGAIAALDAELEAWHETLAPHLRMEFVQDKPSTNIISSRSPLLALTYHYIRTLIHRPAAQTLGSKASASVVALASSSKRIVQLVQLLDERNLNFSHCMNKDELLVVSGFGLLYQATDLDKDGKFMKDVSRMIYTVASMLDCRHAPGAAEFRAISGDILPNIQASIQVVQTPPSTTGYTARNVSVHHQRQLQALTKAPNGRQQLPPSPVAVRKQPLHIPEIKVGSESNTPAITISDEVRRISQSSLSQRRPSGSENMKTKTAIKQALQQISSTPSAINPNLDYLQFKHPSVTCPGPRHSTSAPTLPNVGDNDVTRRWDGLLDTYAEANTNVTSQHIHQQPQPVHHHGLYDSSALYLGAYLDVPDGNSALHPPSNWSPEVWAYNMEQMHMHSQLDQTLGFSDESLTSGCEDFSSIDTSSNGSEHRVVANGLMMPPRLQQDTFAPHHFNALDLEVLNYW